MDNIERDVAAAMSLGYGVHYGHYKADHPNTKDSAVSDPDSVRAGFAICQCCGKEYRQYHGSQRYCSETCRVIVHRQSERESYHRKRGTIDAIVCEGCGEVFKPSHRSQKYCRPACYSRAKRKREKLKDKEAEAYAKALAK